MTLKKTLLAVLIIFCLCIAAALLFLGIKPAARPFYDQKGKLVANSIARLEAIEINGMKQWISIRGRDRNNPVLLWLHGGPGAAQMPLSHFLDQELEEAYVVVHWDQRGAGKSNHRGFSEQDMTVEQFKNDAIFLIDYLIEELDQEKIYLLGHSWGTQLGIKLVDAYPDQFHSYVGVSQVVDNRRAVEIAICWVRQKMEEAKDDQGLTKLESLHDPGTYHHDYRQLAQMVGHYGGNFDQSFASLAMIAFRAPEYHFADYYRMLKGMNRGGGPLHAQGIMEPFNYAASIDALNVPVYFFMGQHDYNTPLVLAEQYYQQLQAPSKELVVFHHSAHTPFIAESEKFSQSLIDIVRKK